MGKKFINDFVFNTITLEEILYKLKIEKDYSYFYELLNDIDVIRIVNQITNRYSFGIMGFLISKEVVKGIVEEELMLLTWKDFKIWLCAQDNIKNGYLAFIYKFLGKKVSNAIKKERPGKKSKEIAEVDFNEKDRIGSDYEYIEILSGGINDLEKISDDKQINKLNNNYGLDFYRINENDKFEEIIENLTENQKNIIRKIYKEQNTEREVAIDNKVSHQSIHNTKKRAIKALRKLRGLPKLQ